MDQLPIDIHLTKLLDWLLNRRNCPRDWQKNVNPIRTKINLAIQDMPENDEITSLLSGSTIHYFNCLKIVEILKETEKNSKNIFGMYSSQRMKDWNSIISAYQKNNIYLGEAASLLQRNVAYEIPALKKQINKCQHQRTECEEKHTSAGKSITEVNIQIKKMCTELGIEGVDISAELKLLPKHINQIYEEIVEKCGNLQRAVDFYTAYIEYFFQRNPSTSLPILLHFIQKGNTTVYEWRTGSAPLQIEKALEVPIKFGDEEEEAEGTDEINFDIDVATLEPTIDLNDGDKADIDWGDFDANIDLSYDNNIDIDTIDYDIDALRNEIQVEGSGVYVPADNIAKGDDALSLLEWSETRNLILNDLTKLETFLKQKYSEMNSESDNLLITTVLQDAPKSIQAVSEKDLKNFNDLIKQVFDYFRLKKVEQIIRINDSPKYLKRLYDQFVLKQKAIKRFNHNQSSMIERQKELTLEEVEINAKLQLIIKKSKELQKFVCEDLSKKYNGVRINLMGEINIL